MENVRLLVGGAIGYFVGSLFNSFLVIAKESDETVYRWLANVFGHHWIGHGILTLLFFIIFTLVGAFIYRGTKLSEELVNKLIIIVLLGTILSVIIIAFFHSTLLLKITFYPFTSESNTFDHGYILVMSR